MTRPDGMPGHRRPLWFGALVAPLAAPFALLALLVLRDVASGGRMMSLAAAVEVFAFALAFGLPIAVVATWLAGLPLAAWLRRRGRLSLRNLCLVAAPFGALAFVAGLAALGARLALVAQVAAGALVGIAVALVFGLACGVSRWR